MGVTGANTGMGFALCKQLILEHGCFVYLGARNVNRGNVALQALMREDARVAKNIALVQVDVADPDSIVAASESVKEKLGNEQLYALVNNAGCIIKDDATKESMV